MRQSAPLLDRLRGRIRPAPVPSVQALFAKVRQVCTVVDDHEATVTNLVEHLGIGPFKSWQFRPPTLYDTTFGGEPAAWTMNLALTWLADVQWEVIQPVDGPSLYREHLERHGRGVQHILMSTGRVPFEQARERLTRLGHGFGQTARINSALQIGPVSLPALPRRLAAPLSLHFGYIDADQTLRTGVELTRYPLGIPERLCLRLARPHATIPPRETNFESSLPNRRVRRVVKLSIVTRDVDDTIRHWIDVAGAAPWHCFELGAERARVAWGLIDDVLIELVEPLGRGPHQEILDTRGEGVAYVGVEPIDDIDELTAHCERLGYTVQAHQPLVGDRPSRLIGARRFLGTDLELCAAGESMPALLARLSADRVVR